MPWYVDDSPDLGDEFSGRGYCDPDWEPSYPTTAPGDNYSVRVVLIPVNWFTKTDDEIAAILKAQKISDAKKRAEEERLQKISALEKELAELKNGKM